MHLRYLLPVTAALALVSAPALAEPTSWLAVGGGYALARNGVTKANDNAFALDGAIGIGTPAKDSPIVIGGVFRTVGMLGFGADMSLSVRLAMLSYCVGDWGLALDLGVGLRLWGDAQYGQFPLHGALIVGMPFGFQVAAGADVWDVSAQGPFAAGGFAALELDFLRLTSMRNGQTTKLWVNPAPPNATPAPAPVTP